MISGAATVHIGSLGGPHTVAAREFIEEFTALNPGGDHCVVLVGSGARGTTRQESDLDLLILSRGETKLPRCRGPFHIHMTSFDEFRERLAHGDDFAAWSTRFGVPVLGVDRWQHVVVESENKPWPDWKRKLPHATRRLVLGAELLEMGDEAAAREELMYALSHVARALLLRQRVFPLSRPELVEQVRELGYPHLGLLIKRFIDDGDDPLLSKEAELYGRKLLVDMDANAYRSSSAVRGVKKTHVQPVKNSSQRRVGGSLP